jgi:hypothetical protein
VAQDVGPAFKPQYCLKKEKKNSGQPGYITRLYLKKKKKKPGMVVHGCNPSYSRGGGRRIAV